MFRILELCRSENGYLLTIEADTTEDVQMVAFLKKAHDFSERYLNKTRIEEKMLIREETREERMAAATAARLRILELFDQLAGDRRAKIRQLRELLAGQGEHVTAGRILESLRLAQNDRRRAREARIHELRQAGRSFRQIGAQLGIPESTVRAILSKPTRMPHKRRSALPAPLPGAPGPKSPAELAKPMRLAYPLPEGVIDLDSGR